jgi:hypothetical protein
LYRVWRFLTLLLHSVAIALSCTTKDTAYRPSASWVRRYRSRRSRYVLPGIDTALGSYRCRFAALTTKLEKKSRKRRDCFNAGQEKLHRQVWSSPLGHHRFSASFVIFCHPSLGVTGVYKKERISIIRRMEILFTSRVKIAGSGTLKLRTNASGWDVVLFVLTGTGNQLCNYSRKSENVRTNLQSFRAFDLRANRTLLVLVE